MDALTLGTSRKTSSARFVPGLSQLCAHLHPLIISERSFILHPVVRFEIVATFY